MRTLNEDCRVRKAFLGDQRKDTRGKPERMSRDGPDKAKRTLRA